jgi:outer membrane lipase/esterase
MKNLTAAAWAALCLNVTTAAAQSFGGTQGVAASPLGGAVYAFGDSLTDNGNLPKYLGGFDYPAPPYYKNHFSNGPVFVEYLPSLIGAGFTAHNDYGVGGAFAGDGNLDSGLIPTLPGTAQEIAAAAAAGLRFGSADTVILWAGSNNYFGILGNLTPGTTIANPTLLADITQVSGAITSDAASLIGLGARRLVVLNIPDLGATPGQTAAGLSVLSTQVSQANNALLQPDLLGLHNSTGANIYLINAQLGIEQILADPAAYGIRNTTQECILVPACVNGSRAVQDTYLFWDEVHPTTGVHDFLAQVIANQLTAGQTVGGQAQLMILQAADFAESLTQRLDSERDTAPAAPFSYYLQTHYASGNRDTVTGSAGFGYQTGGVFGGLDYRPLPGLTLGAAGGYGQPTAKFDDGAGQLGFDAMQGAIYASYTYGGAYLDAAGAYSRFSARSDERPGVLAGQILDYAAAGHSWTGAGGAGYLMHLGAFAWGPAAALTYTTASVDPYTETGNALLTQSVARQNVDSLTGRAGLQATAYVTLPGVSLRPHTAIFAEREFLDGARTLDTTFTSAELPLANVIDGYTGTYGRIQAGVGADIGPRITALFDVEATFGRGNGDDKSVMLKLAGVF